MIAALHTEWTKLRTVAGTGWLLLGVVVLTIGVSAIVAASTHVTSGGGQGQDPTRLSLIGIDLGQAVVAILAVQAISEEYGSGMMRTTLMAMPRRLSMLAAKAANLAVFAFVAGAIAVAGCLLSGRLLLPRAGLGPSHGYALVSLAHSATLRAALGSVLYLVFIALLSLGVATAVRETALAIGGVLGLLYVLPIAAQVITDPRWHRLLERISPMTAGLAVQATTNLRAQPIGPWAGLGVLAAWAAGALVLGGLLLRVRDA
jgi:ABC-2 type transport system permease protein